MKMHNAGCWWRCILYGVASCSLAESGRCFEADVKYFALKTREWIRLSETSVSSHNSLLHNIPEGLRSLSTVFIITRCWSCPDQHESNPHQHRLANVTCDWSWRLCGINPAVYLLFSVVSFLQFLLSKFPNYILFSTPVSQLPWFEYPFRWRNRIASKQSWVPGSCRGTFQV